MPEYVFPDGFLWGSATSAHQVEGNNVHSDWWAWEEAGRVKEFHVRISEILKPYLGEVLGFDVVDRTTTEVLEALSARAGPSRLKSRVQQFLTACDAVKFAEHVPVLSE